MSWCATIAPVRLILATVICFTMLAACSKPTGVADGAREGDPELWSDFRDKPDADYLPPNFDSGQAATSISSPTSETPVIRHGAYTFVPSGPGTAASYYQGRVGGLVHRVRVRFGFDSGTTKGGRMAIAILHKQQIGFAVPSMAAHLVVGLEDWDYGVITPAPNDDHTPQPVGSRLELVGTGVLPTPLSMDGSSEHEVDLELRGDKAFLQIDGHKFTPIQDSRIGDPAYTGSYVFFESYFTAGDTDNRTKFYDVAAW